MTGIAPYSYTRGGGFHIRHGAERQPPSPRVDDKHRPPTATPVGADSISATEQNDNRQARGSMTSIDPYSNPP